MKTSRVTVRFLMVLTSNSLNDKVIVIGEDMWHGYKLRVMDYIIMVFIVTYMVLLAYMNSKL